MPFVMRQHGDAGGFCAVRVMRRGTTETARGNFVKSVLSESFI